MRLDLHMIRQQELDDVNEFNRKKEEDMKKSEDSLKKLIGGQVSGEEHG